MAENETQKPEDILNNILGGLQSDNATDRLNAIEQLKSSSFSSEAIRNKLEKLAVGDANEDVRKNAIAALDLPIHRNVRSYFNKVDRNTRRILLQEITDWEKLGFLENEKAEVIRRRYDFDFAQAAEKDPKKTAPAESATVKEETEATGPRPTFLQSLLSETNIKIALYLGAFFVIASAAILGAFVDYFRIPLLIIGTVVFGGLSVAIRKRLPQPSFALFIVFSFFLPITANVIVNTLDLSTSFRAIYWVIVSLFMTLIWGGGTWLYDSRLFSLTAFAALAVAFYRIGDIFSARPEFFTATTGIAALAGLAAVWALKKWKDSKFALPLFLTTQLLQVIALGGSLTIFILHLLETTPTPLWNLAAVFTWGFACLFYIFSEQLFPFFLFPWFAAGTLFAIPWLVGAAFEFETLGGAVLFFAWGLILAGSSEIIHLIEKARKYNLPVLLISMVAALTAVIYGTAHNETTLFICAAGITVGYAALHIVRPRKWVWAFSLFTFAIAYFAFFKLPFIQQANIFFGYQLFGLSLLLLLPDLFIKSDADTSWAAVRVAPFVTRLYGALFTLWSLVAYSALEEELLNTAIMFGLYTLFFTVYTAVKRKAVLGYIPTIFLSLTIIFTLDHLDLDIWLPTLTGLAVLYFIIGVVIRSNESWAKVLRNSALALGALISISALFMSKETGGWYALVIGLLFIAEMYLRRNGWFEVGMPVMFSIGAFLILQDFEVHEATHYLLAFSLIWLITDLISHFTFKDARPLQWIVRGVGAILTISNYGFLFFDASSATAAIDFGIYTLLFLTVSLVYRQPILLYAFTATLPLFVIFLFRHFDITKWIHPVIFVAIGYYALGFFLRLTKRAADWDTTLLFSGLGLGVIVSVAAPILGGLDAALPVAFAATLWAVEAFWRKNVWLGFPANGLYLLAYFIILFELKVDQPQFYSMGAALLGIIQHYFLMRADSKTGTFIMGMLSQLTLLGTTYIQMISNGSEGLIYFVVLFFQAIAVLVYGVIIRSRSLTFMPIFFLVVGVMSVLYIVVYKLLDTITTIFMVGCTGVLLLGLGVAAVLMRERISKFSEQLSDWKA
jgi:hypothetical protein